MASAKPLAAVLAITAAVHLHGRLLDRPEFVYDDIAQVQRNPDIRSLKGAGRLFLRSWWGDLFEGGLYRPAVHLSFAVDHAVHGPRPAGFRLTNLLLHLAVTALVFVTAGRAARAAGGRTLNSELGTRNAELGVAPLLAALFFGLHPAHAEAVAGIVGRAELLAALSLLGAMLFFQDFLARGGGWRIGAIAFLFALGLFSKESAAVLPIALLLAAPFAAEPAAERGRRAGGLAALAGALLLVGAGWLVLRYQALAGPAPGGNAPPRPLLQRFREAVAPSGEAALLGGRPLLDRIALAGRLAGEYAAMGAAPVNLSPAYPLYPDRVPTFGEPPPGKAGPPRAGALDLLPPAAVLAAALLAAGGLARKSPIAFALLLFLLGLLPVLNLVPIGDLKACRFLYLPSAGLAVAFGSVFGAQKKGPSTLFPFRAAAALAGLTLGLFALLDSAEVAAWRTNLSLWRRAVRATPGSFAARLNLADFLADEGTREAGRGDAAAASALRAESEGHYFAAREIGPEDPRPSLGLGRIALARGRAEEALEWALRAAPLAARTPFDRDVPTLQGRAFLAKGDAAAAQAAFQEAARKDLAAPPSYEPLYYLGVAAAQARDFAAARLHLEEALRLRPDHIEIRRNLALVHGDLRDAARGRRLIEEVLPYVEPGPEREALLGTLDELR